MEGVGGEKAEVGQKEGRAPGGRRWASSFRPWLAGDLGRVLATSQASVPGGELGRVVHALSGSGAGPGTFSFFPSVNKYLELLLGTRHHSRS